MLTKLKHATQTATLWVMSKAIQAWKWLWTPVDAYLPPITTDDNTTLEDRYKRPGQPDSAARTKREWIQLEWVGDGIDKPSEIIEQKIKDGILIRAKEMGE